MRASNKYLFDQAMSHNCKHVIYQDKSSLARCKLNPFYKNEYYSPDGILIAQKYRVTLTIRYDKKLPFVTNHCGPIGKYYEPKE